MRIPSYDSQIGAVGAVIVERMRHLGFDEARFDDMGNVLGRVGSGPKRIVFDSHIDTVGIGDRSQWEWDPLEGKLEGGILYARGAGDEKGSTPPMIYAMAMLKRLSLLEDLPFITSAIWKSGAMALPATLLWNTRAFDPTSW